jgi:ZIP family zinc transporter
MLEAFAWGALGASALLVGALVAYLFEPSRQLIAAVMALGSGLLIGSVSFDVVDEAPRALLLEAYGVEGVLTGPLVVAGFAAAIALDAL